MENFSVTILGSSSAAPTSRRNTTAQLVNFYHRYYLIDCGEGTQVQLRRQHLKMSKINHIFISHLHGDHFFGLVGLISSLNLFGRAKELHIYSDPRIKEVIELQLEISETELQFDIIYHPLNYSKKEKLFEDKKLEIFSFPLEHRIPTCGFLFQEKPGLPNIKRDIIKKYNPDIEQIKEIKAGGDLLTKNGLTIKNQDLIQIPASPRSYAFCSDTKYFDGMHHFFKGVELLYAECTFMKDMQTVATDKYHMTTTDVNRLAIEAEVKNLIVGHFSARYKDISDFEDELLSMQPNAQLVNDLSEYHVRISNQDKQ